MKDCEEFYSVVDAMDPLYGTLQFKTPEEAQVELNRAKKQGFNVKIIKETTFL